MAPPGTKTAERIAGYEVKERIGAGGYGEVWRAEAPGGLAKAVKFVYGLLDDDRAACEMRALNRIKAVRHPFLLSLERIEVFDGQLVIITELAEASLKDRFEECRRQGLTGIPRDELLDYLRDAADALDFMSERHSLQHLDIKPENLLILAERIKVADFGLVKEVRDKSMSLLGGLTPIYAAPEVFEGTPSLNSDQYSLAIVYFEMLTGTLPFPGRTAAQLATQHLHARPQLAALEPADRGPIAQALAKNPSQRFPSCRAMVDALLYGDDPRARGPSDRNRKPGSQAESGTAKLAEDDTGPPRSPHATPDLTVVLDAGAPPGDSGAAGSPWGTGTLVDELLPDEPSTEVRELPPIHVAAGESWFRPVLLVGIGGAAAAVLRRVRGWLADRFGDDDAVPAVQMLLIDTDPTALLAAAQGDQSTALKSDETLAMPLRRASDYRDRGDTQFPWLSRRWLYNVPRSLRTEGLRPLGRLALADRADDLREKLRAAVAAIVSPDALARCQEATGQEPDGKRPRVFVVASISGGTGSGMVLDVACMIRQVLGEAGLSDEGLTGVLWHATNRSGSERNLAAANAYACLTELHHYHHKGHYPGDASCELQARHEPAPVFPHAYLVHVGDELDDAGLAAATDTVAEYLYLNTASSAAAFFDRCRQTASEEDRPSPQAICLRTFGLVRTGCRHTRLPTAAADRLAAEVVARWRGEHADVEGDVVPVAEELAGRLQLDLETLTRYAYGLVQECLAQPPEAFFERLVGYNANAGATSRLWEVVDAVFDRRPDEPGGPGLAAVVEEALGRLAASQADEIRRLVLHLLDASEGRVQAAQRAAGWFLHRVQSLAAHSRERSDLLQAALDGMEPTLRHPKSTVRHWVDYAQVRLQHIVLQAVRSASGVLRASFAELAERLADLETDLRRLQSELSPASMRGKMTPAWGRSAPAPYDPADELLGQQLPELAARLDSQLAATILEEQGGLASLLDRESNLEKVLAGALRAEARTAILGLLRESVATDPAGLLQGDPRDSLERLRSLFEQAAPELLACGGARRTLLVVPRSDEAAALQEQAWEGWPAPPSTAADPNADATLCQEVADLPLRRAAESLVSDRPECIKLAARLRTRIDVPWISMGHSGK